MEEACLEMQRSSAKKDQPVFLSNRTYVQTSVHEHSKHTACPYYAERLAAKRADLVLMPYGYLLDEQMRASLGSVATLDPARHVVIFDEAHNLPAAVEESLAAAVTLPQLDLSQAALSAYLSRYRARLAPAHAAQLDSLADMLSRFAKFLRTRPDLRPPPPPPNPAITTTASQGRDPESGNRWLGRDFVIRHD
ncbi:hypothetical protein PAPYR_12185 [Paratrimastix pyriformis]|uniref:Helicase ATP-binding domain-containing protein n=1 Tax=Paratrimastix pyriformis TaxID=342808 RepID=A0ABQ8U2B5_9EUKA|nr:hypothetical protein PAPYR_12185 [Paratrimastix pyriformis]